MDDNKSRYMGTHYLMSRPMGETVTTKLDSDIDDIKARLSRAEELLQAQDNWIKQMAKVTPFMMWKRDDSPKPEPKPDLVCGLDMADDKKSFTMVFAEATKDGRLKVYADKETKHICELLYRVGEEVRAGLAAQKRREER